MISKPQIVFLVGPSGAGKTTLARSEYPDHVLVEADQFYQILVGKPAYTQEDLAVAGMLTEQGTMRPECHKSAFRYLCEVATCALRLDRPVVLCGAWRSRSRLKDIVARIGWFLGKEVTWTVILLETRFESVHGVDMAGWKFTED